MCTGRLGTRLRCRSEHEKRTSRPVRQVLPEGGAVCLTVSDELVGHRENVGISGISPRRDALIATARDGLMGLACVPNVYCDAGLGLSATGAFLYRAQGS